METWETAGHGHVKSILDKQLSARVFSHAYLFVGQGALGKKTLCLEFARKILGIGKLETSPDFQMLDGLGMLTMEVVQEFVARLRLKPFAGTHKVAIINNAQNLNLQSSNALLKSIEEPTEGTVIILISENLLLPTIVSRCQVFNFYPFSRQEMSRFARDQKISLIKELERLSSGQPGKLVQLARNPAAAKETAEEMDLFDEIMNLPPRKRLLKIGAFAEQETADLQHLLQSWMNDQARRSPQLSVLTALSEAYAELKTNKNKKLILQSLFLKI